MSLSGWRDSVQAALSACGLGDERAVVAIAVEERARRRAASGKGAMKLAVLALTVDSANVARLHQFNRNSESVAQVPKLTRTLAQCTRADEGSEGTQGFEMQFDSGGAASTVLAWLAETEESRKEFLWCSLHLCSLQRRMPASNVDFIDLSLWAQATKLEESYREAHPIFRQQRAEEGLQGDSETPAMNLMSTAEEEDVLELLSQSNLSIVDVRKFEAQLSSKLRALEESNIHSILQSVELAEDVCFRLDSAGNAVDELTSWISEINRGLVDIQDGIREIESQNNKLDTHHTHHEELETTLRGVLEQLSMPDEMQRVLLHTDLGAAGADEMETRVLPAARRLSMGLQLELKSGMADMAVVRQQKAVFEVLRSKFAARAYECVKARFEPRADVRRQAHIMDTPASHALGDRTALYEETMANATALIQVLKVLDRGMFDKVIQRYVVRCLSFMNTKDFGEFFSRLRDAAAQSDKQHSKKINSRLAAANGLGTLPLDDLLDVGCGPAERQQLVGLARAGEWIGNKPALQGLVASFYYGLYCTALHCHREGNFIRSLFTSTADAGTAMLSLNDLVLVNEHDDNEAEHLMEELYRNQSERLLLPDFVGAVSTAASDPDALQLLSMLSAAYEISDLVTPATAQRLGNARAGKDSRAETERHRERQSVLAGGGLFVHNLLSDVISEIRREFQSWIAGQTKDLTRFARSADPKKCGIIPPIVNFVPLVLRVEALLQSMSEDRRSSILQRDDGGRGVFTELVDAIDDCLETVANANEKYTFLVLFQNYGYFATCLRAVTHIPELCDHVELARRCFESNLDAYAASVLTSPPFHGCAEYFLRVLASKVDLPEVQFQSAFSKPNVRKVLKPMTFKAVQMAISDIARKIRRQLATPPATTAGMGEPGSPGGANAAFSVEAVWGRVAQTLSAQWEEWQRLCNMCYGKDVALALTAEQVMVLMDEEARQMARAAASAAVGVASTAQVVATSKAASKWRKSVQQSASIVSEAHGETVERTERESSRMSV